MTVQFQPGRSPAVAASPKRSFAISSQVLPGIIVALDSIMVLSSGLICYLILEGNYTERTDYFISAVVFVWLIGILLMNFAGLYQFQPILQPHKFIEKLLVVIATTFLFLMAAAFALKISATFSRVWTGSFALSACAGIMLARFAAARVLTSLAERRVFTRNAVVAGGGEQMTQFLAHIEKSQPRFLSVLGLFTDIARDPAEHSSRYPVLGKLDDIAEYARSHEVDDVIIALPWSSDARITALVSKLRELPLNVYLGPDMVGFQIALRQPPDHFGDLPVLEIMGRPLAGWGVFWKAAEDYVLAVVLSVLLLPLMALISIAIKIDSSGPVIFRQKRYGFVNQIFYIYKFRTMTHKPVAESKTLQATRDDPRITRIGRFLRRTSLDELPQIINVLNGTMSLVGPRPHAVDHNEVYSQEIRGYFARHRVKPGITGWAQVNGLRGETDTLKKMEDRVKYDISYVENWSLLFDIRILAMTALACLVGRNAY